MIGRLLAVVGANRGIAVAGVALVVLAGTGSVLVGLPPPFTAGLLVAFGATAWAVYRWRSRSTVPRPSVVPPGKALSSSLVAAVLVLAAAQAVPYGRDHSNPPVTGEPAWATPETRELMQRACFDCHSNEVEWPWYSNIAPISWALAKHVSDGRRKVNFQEWDRPQREADETFEVTKEGSMPPPYYTFGGLHRDARLSSTELSTLLQGLAATPGLAD